MMHALVVDDSRVMRMMLRRDLDELGFTVAEAGDGQEALNTLEAMGTELPDLITIDWNMPVMDGLSLVKAVRARDEWRQITLMMVTTEAEQEQIVRALAAGAHEYLIKPFPPEAFTEKLDFLGLNPMRSLV